MRKLGGFPKCHFFNTFFVNKLYKWVPLVLHKCSINACASIAMSHLSVDYVATLTCLHSGLGRDTVSQLSKYCCARGSCAMSRSCSEYAGSFTTGHHKEGLLVQNTSVMFAPTCGLSAIHAIGSHAVTPSSTERIACISAAMTRSMHTIV